MFQRKSAIALMALTIFCSRGHAQSSLNENRFDTSAPVLAHEEYTPLSNTAISSSAADAPTTTVSDSTRSTYGLNPPAAYPDKLQVHPFSRIALGIKADSLGPGVELATPLSRRLNLRATANIFNFRYPFNVDGINYGAEFHFHSGQIAADWFPFHGAFHISPGILYFHNTIAATASVAAGQPFQLSDTSYINSVDDPVSGSASITYAHNIAPTLTIGMGNLIPRTGRHFSVPFEVGVAYLGAAQMAVNLAGTACTTQGCFNAATDPDTQSSLRQEVLDLNNDLAKFKFYPIISLGFGYRF